MTVPPLHVIVTDEVAADPAFAMAAGAVIRAGGERVAIHLRIRRASGGSFYEMARRFASAAAEVGAWCVVNGRVDVALCADAQAVQLGAGSLPVRAARAIVGSRLVVGASVHSADEARARARDGADYVIAGSVFRTATHPAGMPAGPRLVASCAEVGLPVVGIGGIGAGNAGQVMEAGASGIAVVRAVWDEPDPAEAALRLLDAVSGWGSGPAAG